MLECIVRDIMYSMQNESLITRRKKPWGRDECQIRSVGAKWNKIYSIGASNSVVKTMTYQNCISTAFWLFDDWWKKSAKIIKECRDKWIEVRSWSWWLLHYVNKVLWNLFGPVLSLQLRRVIRSNSNSWIGVVKQTRICFAFVVGWVTLS